MMRYIPDDLYIDKSNMNNVSKILNSIPDTCLHIPGTKTFEDAIEEIKDLGEDKVADFLLS